MAKERLAQLIAEQSYNKFAKEYQLFHYFACIPLAEVARYFLESKSVTIPGKPLAQNQEADDEDDSTHDQIQKTTEAYAKEHHTTVEAMLKEGFINWYDVEGFAYTPLIVSDDKKLFERWLSAKAAARSELQRLIDTGTLRLRQRSPEDALINKLYSKGLHDSELKGAKMALELFELAIPGGELDEKKAFEMFSEKVIAGESLYEFPGDFAFVKEFKQRVDEYDPNLGLVYADDDPMHKEEHLDQELLICSLDNKGEPALFSMYNLSLRRLEALCESLTFLKIEKKGKETFVMFENKAIEKVFRDSQQEFITSYGKLLAIRDVFTKITTVYETDVTYRVNGHLSRLDEYIQHFNEALTIATQPFDYLKSKKKGFKSLGSILKIDEKLLIDKEKIVSDANVVEEYTNKLKEILGTFV